MTPERWQEIERVYHAALARPKQERTAFVHEACAGDDQLIREVESLLVWADAASSLLKPPAAGLAVLTCPKCASPIAGPQVSCPACGIDLSSITTAQNDARTRAISAPGAASNTAADDAWLVPEQIGEFRILSRIGRGGSGTVYLAYQESMRRRVALKVLDESAAFFDSELTRFEREAWIAGRLTHPNIVRVYDQGIAGTLRYIVMELVEGRSLAAFIEEARGRRQAGADSDSGSRRRHVRRMVELFVAVADALDYVHRQGIIHRDIKPLNLLLGHKDSLLLITDFGLAQDDQASRVTRRGDFMGTIRYMSPEQLLAQRARVDQRTDLWSFGVSLYEAITLDLPYAGDTEEAYISAVATKEPVPARRRDRALPRDLETVLVKCLERDPDRRYASAADLRDDLSRFLTDQPVKARRAGMVLRMARFGRRHRWPVAAAALAASLIAVTLPITWRRWNEARDNARLRTTLEQVLATGSRPERIQSDWNVLGETLRQQLEQDPHGQLANLARSAATRIVAQVGLPHIRENHNDLIWDDSSYTPQSAVVGLVSRPPSVNLIVSRVFELGTPLHIFVQVEAAVGAGQWASIGWARSLLPGLSQDRSVCSFDLAPLALSVGSNQVNLRAIVTFPDLLESEKKIPGTFTSCSSFPGAGLPTERMNGPAITHFTRKLEAKTVRLFQQYPDEIPKQVDPKTLTDSIDDRFKPERFRLVQVRVPQRVTGSAVTFSGAGPWFTGGLSDPSVCVPRELTASAGLVIGMEMRGVFTATPPVPIAAIVEWRSSDSAMALLAFPLILGEGIFSLDGTSGQQPSSSSGQIQILITPEILITPKGVLVPLKASPVAEQLRVDQPAMVVAARMLKARPVAEQLRVPIQRGTNWTYDSSAGISAINSGVVRFRDLVWLRQLLREESTPGVLDLRPARDLALTNYFEKYLGHLSMPVPLEVRTLEGRWIDDPGCTSATRRR